MTPEEWQRVRPILESALELDSAHRPAFLAASCANQFVRCEVESLIAAHEQAGTTALGAAAIPSFLREEELRFRLVPGTRIAQYEILEEIAQGGMGAVYRALRADGQYNQQVALKIVRADLGAELTATRFRNERQILASLDHPNIAKILDGGTATDGLPYFVMELIDGLPLTEYCDRHKLPIDARLKIFRTVCSAVHYAHQHLVIHRDIKPTNILVTAEGAPKLLDFGIAKIFDPNLLPDNVTRTMAGLWMMTPEYASPEQLRGQAVTTATDVYSLGLVLYELLTGHRAFRFASRMPHEIARAVMEDDPAKPSTAVWRKETIQDDQHNDIELTPESVSGLRAGSPAKLQRRLTGDLDNIVLKAIRKEPRERYTSADQLSEDVRRHLAGLPVLARKGTVAYRCRKYMLRHQISVAAAALVLLSLLTGIALTVREARIARANQLRAEQRFKDVRSLANSLIFDVHDSIKNLPGSTPARKLIVDRALRYLDSLAAEASGDNSLQRELANAYVRVGDVQGNFLYANLGDTQGAVASYRKALAIQESALARDPQNRDLKSELFLTYFNLGWCLNAHSDFKGALASLRKALEFAEASAGQKPDPAALDRWAGGYFGVAGILTDMGDLSGALENYRNAVAIRQKAQEAAARGHDALIREHLAGDYAGMALVLSLSGDSQSAIDAQRQALTITEELSSEQPDNATLRYWVGGAHESLGEFLKQRGSLDTSLVEYRTAKDIFTKLAKDDSSNALTKKFLAFTHVDIGDALLAKRRPNAAIQSFHNALEVLLSISSPIASSDRIQFAFAEAYAGLGGGYSALASHIGLTTAAQIDEWRKAKAYYEKSSDFWAGVQARHALISENAREPERVQQQIATCNAALNKLGARAARYR